VSDISHILQRIEAGDQIAMEELFPLVYEELRRLAAAQLVQERPGQTLQATALVHEAWLRLVGPEGTLAVPLTNRRYFFGAAAEAMRRILIEQARRKKRQKHGGELQRVEFQDAAVSGEDAQGGEMLRLDQALEKLTAEYPLAGEIVRLKYFAGLGREAIAEVLGLSVHEVRQQWEFARAYLQVSLGQSMD